MMRSQENRAPQTHISLKQMVSAMPNTEGMSASERNKLDQALLESFMQLLGPDWKSKLEGG